MEIITGTDFSYERLYCPSTGEVIMGPILNDIVIQPKAVGALWDYQFIDTPEIYDPKIRLAWDAFCKNWRLKDITLEMVEKFLTDYDNPDWKVYECELEGMGCGPISRTILYVVKADTIVEVHPAFEDEAF